jgi:hypothetical protein
MKVTFILFFIAVSQSLKAQVIFDDPNLILLQYIAKDLDALYVETAMKALSYSVVHSEIDSVIYVDGSVKPSINCIFINDSNQYLMLTYLLLEDLSLVFGTLSISTASRSMIIEKLENQNFVKDENSEHWINKSYTYQFRIENTESHAETCHIWILTPSHPNYQW